MQFQKNLNKILEATLQHSNSIKTNMVGGINNGGRHTNIEKSIVCKLVTSTRKGKVFVCGRTGRLKYELED